uniref:Ribosomal protein S7 n=1 Tax=Nitzschia sp. NIES-3576 TaxID=2083273 RepID=A0A2Z5ZBI2_9STRA|nr:ribosomal protein S7 [Nitzschia sp. NIES-3576]
MSRKKNLKKNYIEADSVYNNFLISLLISKVLKSGKKSLANYIVYTMCSIIKAKTNKSPIDIIKKAIIKVTPKMELRDKKIRNRIKKVPIEVSSYRATYLALKWIIKFSKKRNEKTMSEKLAYEVLDILNNNSEIIKERKRIHRIAKSNKSFMYYFKS